MNRIKQLREETGKTMKQVASELGIPYTTYVNYEKDLREPNSEMLIALANYFNVSIDFLICKSDNRQNNTLPLPPGLSVYHPKGRMPVLGRVAAGLPLFAQDNIEDYAASDFTDGETYYCLRVDGDSMTAAGIDSGDLVVVRQQATVDPEQIAVVLVNGDDATIKYFQQQGDLVILSPKSFNPAHQPQIYNIKETPVRIIGRVVEIRKSR